jgi:hypothetical protein
MAAQSGKAIRSDRATNSAVRAPLGFFTPGALRTGTALLHLGTAAPDRREDMQRALGAVAAVALAVVSLVVRGDPGAVAGVISSHRKSGLASSLAPVAQ